MYRRPLPSANLRFLSTLMWDGRESSTQTGTTPITFPTNPTRPSLRSQDINRWTPRLVMRKRRGRLRRTSNSKSWRLKWHCYRSKGRLGRRVARQPTPQTADRRHWSTNRSMSGSTTRWDSTLLRRHSIRWFSLCTMTRGPMRLQGMPKQQRASIVRGQTLFNSRPINITGVGGLNDATGLPVIKGTCGTCHDSPNVGNHSVSAPLNIGVSDLDSPLDVKYLPVSHFVKSKPEQGHHHHRSRPGSHHGKMGRYWQVQRTSPTRIGGAGTLFPQWFGGRI